MSKTEDIKATTISKDLSASLTENEKSTVQLSLKSHSYTWSINDFSNCLEFRNCQFNSPTFTFENIEWRLRLSIITENDKVKNMKVLLQNKTKIVNDLYFKNNISIMSDDGEVLSQADVEFCSAEGSAVLPSPVYLVAPWGSESFVLPNKLIVRSKFTSLISEMKEDTEIKSSNQNVSDSPSGAFRVAPTKRRTRSSVSPHTRLSSMPLSELDKFFFTLLAGFLSSFLLFIVIEHAFLAGLSSRVSDVVSTSEGSEINDLIFDSTKKLSLISEALNLTTVKEKSLEILALFTMKGMYNGTEHVQPATQSIESNLTESLASKISSFVASEVKQFILDMSNDTKSL